MKLKQAAAFMLSAAMLLQPMTVSAATWGNVVSAIKKYKENGGGVQRVSKGENDKLTIQIENGKLTITGGEITDGVLAGGPPWANVTNDILSIVLGDVEIFSDADGNGVYVDSGNCNVIDVIISKGAVINGRVMVNARKNTSLTVEGKVDGEVQANAYGGTITAENSGSISGEFKGSAEGDGSSSTIVNKKDGEVGAMDGFALGDGATMTIYNEGEAGELLANALAGGTTNATNDGDVSMRTSGWSKGDGSTLTITNNGNSGTMSAEAYLDGKASLTNNGMADGGIGGYTEGGRVDLVNNGTVNGNMAVGAEKEGHVSADNREGGTIYGDLKGWTDGVGSTAYLGNSGGVKGRQETESLFAMLDANASAGGEAVVTLDAQDAGQTYHDDATTPENVTSSEAQPGAAGEGVLSGERWGSGTVVVEDKNGGSTNVNGKKVDATLNVSGSTTHEQLNDQLKALDIWNRPGEYTILVKRTNADGTVGYEAMTICVGGEAEEKPAEDDGPSEESIRHEMEMQRQEEAVGGVFGSPYWIRQMYLGYHSYNLRLYVGEKRANMREYLSWNADKTKGISFRVNAETPEKLTMRFDERVLEVFERTDITVITLMDKNGTPMMQYNVSDLRIAYDGFGLHDTDQLVVGGVDDEVMKIGADGQMVAAEE